MASLKTMKADETSLTATQRAVSIRSLTDLPFCHFYTLNADKVLELSGVARLGDLSPKNVVVAECINAIAKSTPESFFALDDAAQAFGTTLRIAASKRHVLWLSAVTTTDLEKIESIIGPDLVHPVGLDDAYTSAGTHDTELVPVALSPTALIQAWSQGTRTRRDVLARLLDDTDTLVMDSANLNALREAGTNLIERHPIQRFLANPKTLAYLVVFVYSSLRALPVVFVPGFVGNVWILWTIDIVTAIPYTWGIVELFAGRTLFPQNNRAHRHAGYFRFSIRLLLDERSRISRLGQRPCNRNYC